MALQNVFLWLTMWGVLLGGVAAQEGTPEARPEGGAAAGEEDGAVTPNGIYFHYALFYAPEPEGEPLKEAHAILEKDFQTAFTYRAEVVKFVPGRYVEFRQVEREAYAPPTEDYLEHKGFGLSEEERAQVQESETVLLLDFFVVDPKDYGYLTAANHLTAAIARDTGALIWDEETREMYSVAAWAAKRLTEEFPLFSNTSMHAYELPSKNFRSVTFGMRKLGLPDLVIAEFPKAFWDPVSKMMRFLVAQVGSGGPLAPKTQWTGEELRGLLGLPAGSEVPDLGLRDAPRDEGDPRNDLLTVDFAAFPGESYQEKQLYAIGRLFETEGGLLEVWRRREALMELSESARKSLGEKKLLWEKGWPKGDQLLVKAFIEDEYLWLTVRGWEGQTLEGVRVPDITPDGRLLPVEDKTYEVELDQVFDYLHVYEDGREEGDETGKLIREIQRARVGAGGVDSGGEGVSGLEKRQ